MMKVFFVCVLFCFVLLANAEEMQIRRLAQFTDFKRRFGKQYPSSAREEKALRHFVRNMELLEKGHWKENEPLATTSVTQFFDRPLMEDRPRKPALIGVPRAASVSKRLIPASYNSKATSSVIPSVARAKKDSIPKFVDWRAKGAVTPVQNEGESACGVAFAAAANIEGVNFVTNQLTKVKAVSIKELECGNCGYQDSAYQFILQNKNGNVFAAGTGEEDKNICSVNNKNNGKYDIVANLTKVVHIAANEQAMTEATAKMGPINVIINGMPLELYTGGILSNCSTTPLDTAVAIVGYNDESATPYWIVKNSWGASWGINGYAYIAKGSNQCGISSYPVSVEVQKKNVPPPTPSVAPTAAPSGTFTQKDCTNSQCSEGCRNISFAVGKCLPVMGGGSAIVQCTATTLSETIYSSSSDCTGASQKNSMPLNMCLQSTAGGYFENYCQTSTTPLDDQLHKLLQQKFP